MERDFDRLVLQLEPRYGTFIDSMYAGKSGKEGRRERHGHRGRRARPTAEKLAELVSEAEEIVDDYDYAYNATTVSEKALLQSFWNVFKLLKTFKKCSKNHLKPIQTFRNPLKPLKNH